MSDKCCGNCTNDIKGNPRGVVRQIDNMGRIVIPSEYRKELGIELRDSVEMMLFDNSVFIKKH